MLVLHLVTAVLFVLTAGQLMVTAVLNVVTAVLCEVTAMPRMVTAVLPAGHMYATSDYAN